MPYRTSLAHLNSVPHALTRPDDPLTLSPTTHCLLRSKPAHESRVSTCLTRQLFSRSLQGFHWSGKGISVPSSRVFIPRLHSTSPSSSSRLHPLSTSTHPRASLYHHITTYHLPTPYPRLCRPDCNCNLWVKAQGAPLVTRCPLFHLSLASALLLFSSPFEVRSVPVLHCFVRAHLPASACLSTSDARRQALDARTFLGRTHFTSGEHPPPKSSVFMIIPLVRGGQLSRTAHCTQPSHTLSTTNSPRTMKRRLASVGNSLRLVSQKPEAKHTCILNPPL